MFSRNKKLILFCITKGFSQSPVQTGVDLHGGDEVM